MTGQGQSSAAVNEHAGRYSAVRNPLIATVSVPQGPLGAPRVGHCGRSVLDERGLLDIAQSQADMPGVGCPHNPEVAGSNPAPATNQ